MIKFSGEQGVSVTPNNVSNVEISDGQTKIAREIYLDEGKLGQDTLNFPHYDQDEKVNKPSLNRIGPGT